MECLEILTANVPEVQFYLFCKGFMAAALVVVPAVFWQLVGHSGASVERGLLGFIAPL